MDLFIVEFGQPGDIPTGFAVNCNSYHRIYVRSNSFDQAAKKALLSLPEHERSKYEILSIGKAHPYID